MAGMGVLCDPFGLDHSATDTCYPHLSLCGANSFFIFLELDHSASQPFKYYHHVNNDEEEIEKLDEYGLWFCIVLGQ